MAKYNTEELYEKMYLTIPETSFLLGDIPLQNVYKKLDTGQLEYTMIENDFGNPVKRVLVESVFRYILKRRKKLQERYNRYRLPDIKFIKTHESLRNILEE